MASWAEKIKNIWRLARPRENAKPPLRQRAEMAALLLYRGIGPGFYQLAGLWHRDVSWRDITRYMNLGEYHEAVDRLNKPAYQKLSQSKVAEKALLQLFGIPSTKLLGMLNPLVGRTVTGRPLRTPDELQSFLRAVAPQRICFKASEGWGGSSFRAVEVSTDDERLAVRDLKDGAPVDLEALYRSFGLTNNRTVVVEEMMRQHPALAAFNPTSVNTLRIWVIDHGHGPRTRLAYFRMGRAGALVDNHSSGGILAAIDLPTGRLAAAVDGTAARRLYPTHPDSGAPIEGVVLPFFEEAKRLAEECLGIFPNLNFAGVDVAISPEGPLIVEMNVVPDMVGSARVGIPTKDALAPF